MTRMTGPDCAVMCKLINIYSYIHTCRSMRMAYNDSDDRAGLRGYVQFHKYTYIHTGTLSLSKNCTSRESVSPLSRLIRGFRNKYH